MGIGLANLFVLVANEIDWQWTFAIVGISGFLVTVATWFFMGNMGYVKTEAESPGKLRADLRQLVKNRTLVIVTSHGHYNI